MLLFLLPAAFAKNPTLVVTREGNHFEASVDVSAPLQPVVALVRDTPGAARAAGRKIDYEPLPEPEASCARYRMQMPSMLGKIGAVIRACDIERGTSVTMVESDDFEQYTFTYTVEPLGEGQLRIRYTLDLVSASFVPQGIVAWATMGAVRSSMDDLSQFIAREMPSPPSAEPSSVDQGVEDRGHPQR